jgi:hypothetical protein
MRTVFILGAGASMPFGFPSAYNLTSRVLGNLQSKREVNLLKSIPRMHFDDDTISAFVQAIKHSVPKSIDELLQTRREFIGLGRAAIAQALMPFEQPEKLFARDNEQNWYGLIFDRLKGPPEALPSERMSFITLNYDRSLEHYLFEAFRAFYGMNDAGCRTTMEKIPIIHIYGQLGYLPWQRGDECRPYLPSTAFEDITLGARHLRLIHESPQNDDTLSQARRLLSEADKVYFLGCGYHESYMQLFDLSGLSLSTGIFGTSCGLTEAEKKIIMDKHRRLYLDVGTDRTIFRYLREYGI